MIAPKRPRRLLALRHADEWVGAIVIVAALAFLGAVLQAGVLRDWLVPSYTLRVLLPEEGTGGLQVGNELEVLGTRAGTVRRVVIPENQRLYAEVQVDAQARNFIRRDSTAVIRRRFGVAGAAFIDVTRGTGAPLDWTFAVIEATTDRPPTETVGALIDEARNIILPIIADLGRTTRAFAEIVEGVRNGEGTVGNLLRDDAIARQAAAVVQDARGVVTTLDRTLANIEGVSRDARGLTSSLTGREGIPAILRRADAAIANIERITRDIQRASTRAPNIARNVERATEDVPALLLQAEAAARELEALTTQLRGLWLLGGGGAAPPDRGRVPVER
ncbi:MAG: MlaD family protein, partial [Acetobacteraceae bacterium]|nr:MlaD family protein [Acetobacteraceae bacterium]